MKLLLIPLIIYLGLVAIALTASYSLIFPYRGSSYDKSLSGLEIIQTPDGQEVATLYQQAPNERYLALYFHGNAEDCGHVSQNSHHLRTRGISVLAMDYPGYGLSEGKPTEESCQTAAETLYQLALEKGYTPEKIILWGRSVGSGVAMGLAETIDCRAVVLENPFATAFTVQTRIPILPFDRFHNLKKAKKMTTPLFIIHGANDRMIPPRHSEQLYEAHRGKVERHLINGAGHNDLWLHSVDDAMSSLLFFLKDLK